MARKVGQIIARGDRRWLIRVYLGRDRETNKRNYHNRTIHGSMREAQAYLTRKLRERDLGRDLEGAKITLNEYLNRWLETAVKPRVREKTCQDYEGMLRRYIRPCLGERVLVAMRPLDIQATYHQMIERGLSARTVHYTHVVLKSAMRQALQWRLLLENPADGVKTPQQHRDEMRSLTVEQAQTFLKAALATPHGPVFAVALTTGMRPSDPQLRLSRQVPRRSETAPPSQPTLLRRSRSRSRRSAAVRPTHSPPAPSRLGRLCQASLRWSHAGVALSRSLHPPRGHLQSSLVELRPRARYFSLEGLRPRRQARHDDAGRHRVPAALLSACAPERVRAHPSLRVSRQSLSRLPLGTIPTTAVQ